MPTAAECVCCCKVYQTADKITETGDLCITEHEGFGTVCLNVWVQQTVYFQYYQQYGDFQENQSMSKSQ